MDEAVGFQVCHALADIQTDTQQAPLVKAAPPLPEVVQQAALLHELRDNVDWPLLAAHPIQLYQFGVGQFPGEGSWFCKMEMTFSKQQFQIFIGQRGSNMKSLLQISVPPLSYLIASSFLYLF